MARDRHFGTGEYDPRAYWTERAERCGDDLWQTVCGYGLSAARNRAMDRMQRHLLGSLLGRRLDGRRLLDFGCGAGRLSGWFLDRGARYRGVDLSPGMLELARERHLRADFRLLEGSRLPFDDSAFDLTASVTVLHHNPYPRQPEILYQLLRVLRPGGLLLLLERAGPRRDADTLFTLYPRPLDDWVTAVTRDGGAELVRLRRARRWILTDAVNGVARRLRLPRSETFDDRLASLGERLDLWLLPLLPARRATAAAMVFRKR